MNHDPEIEFILSEMFGQRDSAERSRAQSVQNSTNEIDRFFERLDLEKSLGHGSAALAAIYGDPPALEHLREFVKSEKQKVPNMSMRQIRGSAVQLLRKAADALASI